METRVAAVIPSFQSARWVAEAVESVLAQTLPVSEVIVVDDGSTDGTADVLRTFADRITVVRRSENGGLACARNHGVDRASADLIGFLDADDAWLPEMVERQVAEFRANPDLGMCATASIECGESLDEHLWTRQVRPRRAEDVFDELFIDAFPMAPSSVFVRRSALETAGGFDPTMRKAQDIECWLRIAMRYPVSTLPVPLCLRRHHPGSITRMADPRSTMFSDCMVFTRCAAAAREVGRRLPMEIVDRIALSRRRRAREFAEAGELDAADVFRDALMSSGAWTLGDRLGYESRAVWAQLRRVVRRPWSVVQK